MKVTLKAARLLAKQLDALVNSSASKVRATKEIELSAIDHPDIVDGDTIKPFVDAAYADYNEAIDQTVAIVDTMFSLRNKVALVNQANNIDAKVAESALLTRKVAFYTQLLKNSELQVQDCEVQSVYINKVCRSIKQLAAAPQTGYRQNSVSVRLLQDDDIRKLKQVRLQMTTKLDRLRSDLAALNSSLEIELSDSEVCVLEYHSLV